MDINKALPTLALVVTVAAPVWYMAVSQGTEAAQITQLVEDVNSLETEFKSLNSLVTNTLISEADLRSRVVALEREVFND